jgi:hypothetical protein
MLNLNMTGKKNHREDHPDISHIPNDKPIPAEYPEDKPNEIPVDEPSESEIPGPIKAPIKEPTRNPKIRVLNIE